MAALRGGGGGARCGQCPRRSGGGGGSRGNQPGAVVPHCRWGGERISNPSAPARPWAEFYDNVGPPTGRCGRHGLPGSSGGCPSPGFCTWRKTAPHASSIARLVCHCPPRAGARGGLWAYGSTGGPPSRGRGIQSIRKRSTSGGRMRAGARKRRTHESRQCVAGRMGCTINLWRAAKNGRAESPAHMRPPRGRSERQHPSRAPLSCLPAARPIALRRIWARSPNGRRVPRSRWSGEAGSARPTNASWNLASSAQETSAAPAIQANARDHQTKSWMKSWGHRQPCGVPGRSGGRWRIVSPGRGPTKSSQGKGLHGRGRPHGPAGLPGWLPCGQGGPPGTCRKGGTGTRRRVTGPPPVPVEGGRGQLSVGGMAIGPAVRARASPPPRRRATGATSPWLV